MLSRREVLMMLVAAPAATMVPGVSLGAPHVMTVNDAMRYLCDEVFPSPNQKRNELHCAADRWHKKRSV